jgi:beta-glucosidase
LNFEYIRKIQNNSECYRRFSSIAPKGTIDKPAKVVVDFGKTKLLKPRKSEILQVSIGSKEIATFYTEKSQWIAEAGIYKVLIEKSSKDIVFRFGI